MKTQELLHQYGLDHLKNQLAIKVCEHDDGRVILNYNQIDSPKLHPCVRECRGLVLDSKDWSLVARSFPRFFNLGECLDEQQHFVWEGSISTDKEDGSLIILYHYNGGWHMNTRGSFGSGEVNSGLLTWRQLFELAVGENWQNKLNPQYTYVGELCSLHNQVVRLYERPSFFLLSVFDGPNELSWTNTQEIADCIGWPTPTYHEFSNSDDVVNHITKVGEVDNTYEGIVVRDKNNMRIKVKSPLYVSLHGLAGNGNIASPKKLLPWVMAGEVDELIAYFPMVEKNCRYLEKEVNRLLKEVDNLWFCFNDVDNRKKYAEHVKDHPLSWALFKAKDTGVDPVTLIKDNPEKMLGAIKWENS